MKELQRKEIIGKGGKNFDLKEVLGGGRALATFKQQRKTRFQNSREGEKILGKGEFPEGSWGRRQKQGLIAVASFQGRSKDLLKGRRPENLSPEFNDLSACRKRKYVVLRDLGKYGGSP